MAKCIEKENKLKTARFRVTESQLESLPELAAKAGFKTYSEWIHSLVFGSEPKRRRPSEHRASLIKALNNLSFIRAELEKRPENVLGYLRQLDFIANTIHIELENGSH